MSRIVSNMTLRDSFEDQKSLINYLASQLNSGRLALFLGSGISSSFGLPMWTELINRLYADKGDVVDDKIDLKRRAENFRIKYYSSDYAGFVNSVRKALYKGVEIDFVDLNKNSTLSAIGALVMASQRGSASQVVTFNWDNLLEIYLEYHGFVTHSVSSEIHWNDRVDVTILHPHGFLPYSVIEQSSENIIFDQKSYSQIVGKENRPWAQKLLDLLRTHTCLFIGLSGEDDNLDSLLLTSKEHHASLTDNTAFRGIKFDTIDDEAKKLIWEERGVFYKLISNYNVELPEILFSICQEAAKLRKNY